MLEQTVAICVASEVKLNHGNFHSRYIDISWPLTGRCFLWISAIFNIECRKPKIEVITVANHKEHGQSSEPIKT